MRLTVRMVIAVGAIVICAAVVIIGFYRSSGGQAARVSRKAKQVQAEGQRDWPMFGGGQGLAGAAEGSLAERLKLVWKFRTGREIRSSAAIVEGVVYIGSNDANIYAINLESGEKRWGYRTEGAVEAACCVVDGVVFAGSEDGWLYAVEADGGKLKWKYKTGAKILGAANWTEGAEGKRIMVGSYDGSVHCVRWEDGQAVWRYETDSYVNGTPAVGEGKVIFGGCDAKIHVVSAIDGNQVNEIDTGSYIAASAALYEGGAYVGNYDNEFIKADVASGEILWRYSGGDEPFFSSAAAAEGKVVFGGRDGRVHCVNSDDGKACWTFQTGGEVDSSPAICGG
ncbi:MAG: outer membrane protein assembly factor BamB family protein, partial [Planctomycetota bacterium]